METQETMGFGKYKGLPLCEVPVDYLAWVLDTFRSPPTSVLAELQRRGGDGAGGASFIAYAAVSKHKFQSARRKSRKPSRRPANASRKAAARKDIQRQMASEHLRRLSRGVMVVGAQYASERARWESGGGDPASCPFGEEEVGDFGGQVIEHLRSIMAGG